MRLLILLVLLHCTLPLKLSAIENSKNKQVRPNLLIVTVDDMSADSLGIYGCELSNTSPNIDSFAQSAMRFKHAHVQVGNCMPGRNIMWSGMYSHRNGVEGFVQNKSPDYPVLCDLAQNAGYFTAIRGKVSHSTPYTPYQWDAVLDSDRDGRRYHTKDPSSYGDATSRGIALANVAGKPFCLMVNISDPHKPFYKPGTRGGEPIDSFIPSRVFTPEEVPTPGFLFEDRIVREELALYYSSVRRADDAFQSIHQALENSGQSANTVVLFCSDHGMPLPFAKTQLYYHSTRTPLMIRWPGVTTAGYVDGDHMVSSIDFLPTILDIIGARHPEPIRLQGRSFAPLLRGEQQANRDHIILQYNENSGGSRHPMRGLLTKEYLFLFNPWSNGKRRFATATTGTATYRRMKELATNNASVSRRLNIFDHREMLELYDVNKDPNCLTNLVGYTEERVRVQGLRRTLGNHLLKLGDPIAPLLINQESEQEIQDYMHRQDRMTLERQQIRRQSRLQQKSGVRKLANIALVLKHDPFVLVGKECQVEVSYEVPNRLGEQILQVTLKREKTSGTLGIPERIHRISTRISGSGSKVFSFSIPVELKAKEVRFAAFIGTHFNENIIHKVTGSIEVKE